VSCARIVIEEKIKKKGGKEGKTTKKEVLKAIKLHDRYSKAQ
jgi:hypothetical protein